MRTYFEIPVAFVVLAETEDEAASILIDKLTNKTYDNPGSGPNENGWPTTDGKADIDTWYLPNHRPDVSDNHRKVLDFRYADEVNSIFRTLVRMLWPADRPQPSIDEMEDFMASINYADRDLTHGLDSLFEQMYDYFHFGEEISDNAS